MPCVLHKVVCMCELSFLRTEFFVLLQHKRRKGHITFDPTNSNALVLKSQMMLLVL